MSRKPNKKSPLISDFQRKLENSVIISVKTSTLDSMCLFFTNNPNHLLIRLQNLKIRNSKIFVVILILTYFNKILKL